MSEIPPGYRVIVVDPDGDQVGEVRLGDNLDEGMGGAVLIEGVAEEIARHERGQAATEVLGRGHRRRG